MWNRKELKAKAKAAFKNNYWRCVLVTIIVALLVGIGSAFTAKVTVNDDSLTVNGEAITAEQVITTVQDTITQVSAEANMTEEELLGTLLVVGVAVASIIAAFATVNALLKIFVWDLFEIGGDRFFTVNSDGKASLKEIFRGFAPRYGRNVWTLVVRNLYLFLWSLLFVIPGIVKAYSYRLIPYLLAENPDMSRKEAFMQSRQLMRGSKWKAFVLDLSFLGWDILSCFTFGLLQIFYVMPYKDAANAELYKALTAADEAF